MPKTHFPAVLDFSEINGKNGVKINGEAASDHSGLPVRNIGDINGDGMNDFAIGAAWADPKGKSAAGITYVIFGHDGVWPSVLALSSLDGANGFKINGEAASDMSGFAISAAGDVNGDGVVDLVIGAKGSDPGGRSNAGSTYVVFGHNGAWSSELKLSTLDGTNGFKINGELASDYSGSAVSGAGDINGDGFADIIIGAYFADPNGISRAGSSYVVFGHNGAWPSVIELSTLDGTTGFKINGEVQDDFSGHAVSYAGDINHDGIDDFIIGAYAADLSGRMGAGSSYLVFGHTGVWPSVLELSTLDGTIGTKIHGEFATDSSGYSVSYAGDVNDDGVDDLIIGATSTNPYSISGAGSTYVIFGHSGVWPSVLEYSTLDGTTGFSLYGEGISDASGYSVDRGGDINGDGVNDVIIGVYYADPDGKNEAGASYVVFGHNGTWPSMLSLSTLNGTLGFEMHGEFARDGLGRSVSYLGDVNGDGIDDFIVGATGASVGSESYAGSSYLIFGDIYTAALTANQLPVRRGESRIIMLGNLNAIDAQHGGIWFQVSDVTHGYFDNINNAGVAISSFTKEEITNHQIRFVHDGTDSLPAYAVTVRTEKFACSEATPAFIFFSSPALSTTVSPMVYVEKSGANEIDTGLTITYPESIDLLNATVAVASNFYDDQDVLSFSDQLGIHGVYDDVVGVLTLVGVSSLANYQVALRSVTYENLSKNPMINTRMISFMVYGGSEMSLPAMRNVTIVTVNDRPELIMTSNPLNYVEDSGAVAIDAGVTIVDPDAVNLINATVAVTHNFYAAEDVLAFMDQHGITGFYDSGMGKLTLTGVASMSYYQSALRSVTYENVVDNPTTTTRTVSFIVHDGDSGSLPGARNVYIGAQADCPVLIGGSTLIYTENEGDVVIDNSIDILDSDSAQLVNGTVSITEHFYSAEDVLHFTNQNGISGSYNGVAGKLILTGTTTLANYQAALRSVRYENLSKNPSADIRKIAFIVNDGVCNSHALVSNVQVNPVNDRPALDHNQLTITEGQNVTLTASELSATDIDCDDEALIFTVNTVQHGEFRSTHKNDQTVISFAQRNITQGNIYFQHDGGSQAPAYFVRVSDGELTNIDGFQPASVTFVPVNDPPVLTYNQLTVYRGQSKYLTNTDLSATDEETNGEDLIFTISNLQHGYFEDVLTEVPAVSFTQNRISQAIIQFVHDGTSEAPNYAVSVSDGVNALPPANAVITFVKKDAATIAADTGIFDNTLYRALTIGGISGFIGLVFLIVRICLYRKATKSIERLTDASQMGTTMEQQKDFQKNVLRPIAKAIFDRVKITGCLGYISDNRMQDYLNAVMRIVVELQQQGIVVELDRLKPAGQTLLINEIAKQTEQILVPKQGCCSCGCCSRCLGRLCGAEVSPETIEHSATRIAVAVKVSLRQNDFDTYLLKQSIADSMDVDIQIKELPFEMRTLKQAGMLSSPIDALVDVSRTSGLSEQSASMSASRPPPLELPRDPFGSRMPSASVPAPQPPAYPPPPKSPRGSFTSRMPSASVPAPRPPACPPPPRSPRSSYDSKEQSVSVLAPRSPAYPSPPKSPRGSFTSRMPSASVPGPRPPAYPSPPKSPRGSFISRMPSASVPGPRPPVYPSPPKSPRGSFTSRMPSASVPGPRPPAYPPPPRSPKCS